jgi:hypothetical protein
MIFVGTGYIPSALFNNLRGFSERETVYLLAILATMPDLPLLPLPPNLPPKRESCDKNRPYRNSNNSINNISGVLSPPPFSQNSRRLIFSVSLRFNCICRICRFCRILCISGKFLAHIRHHRTLLQLQHLQFLYHLGTKSLTCSAPKFRMYLANSIRYDPAAVVHAHEWYPKSIPYRGRMNLPTQPAV